MISLARVVGAFQEGSFYIASFLLVLSVVVFVHEYGHYAVAKLCKVKVKTFSLGLGPELFGITDGSGTRWKFSLAPVGGYVRMLGDSPEAQISEEDKPGMLSEKPLWQRFSIAAAGPMANFLFSLLVFFILFATRGMMTPIPIVGHVAPGGIAEQLGVKIGDRIVSVDGNKILWFEEIRHYIVSSQSPEFRVDLMRDGRVYSIKLDQNMWSDSSKKLGISASASPEHNLARRLPLLRAAAESFRCVYRIVRMTLTAVTQLVTGTRSMDELGGPVRIARHSGESIRNKEGLWFIGIISANLGVINLLPIPMLDGGHMLQYVIQGVFRRKTIDPKYQNIIVAVGFVLLVSLMVFVTFNDIKSIFK